MEQNPRLSLVIPAWNEEALLPTLLDTVDDARARYRGGADSIEVIVADNVSTDRTPAIANERGCRVVTVEKRVIAAVRNGGASVARGDIVAFIDADSTVHPETFNAIAEAMGRSDVVAGSTGLRRFRGSAGLATTYAILLAFAWATSMDTGVVFCRRRDFDAIGGYREDMDFGEDVWFLKDLRKLGRAQGQDLIRVRSAKATSSTRKFDEYGDWHYLANFVRSGYWYFRDKAALREWGREYWYRGRE